MKVAMKEASKTTGHKPAAYYVHQSVAPEIILDTPRLLPLRTHTNNSFPKNKRATKTLRYGGFGCTIRSVPLRWLTIGFRAFDKLFYNRNSIISWERSHGNRDPQSFVSTKRSQSLLGCGLPTFHVVFQESNIKP